MSKKRRIGTALTAAETRWGFVYLLVELFALPSLLFWANDGLDVPFTEAEVNILFYLINFLAMLVIFHDFLGKSAWQVAQHPMQLCEAVVLGLAAYYALTYCTMLLITPLDLHHDGGGPGVDGVFHQLLYNGGGPLHHLTGGDQIGNMGG